MSVVLDNKFSFPSNLVEQAVAFPAGHFVEVEDLAFEANGLARKIVQTQLVQIDGREVSVGYLNQDDTGYELVLASEGPRDLGSFDKIIRGNPSLFEALQHAFGGSVSSYNHIEMVVAINKAATEGVSANDEIRIRGIAASTRIYLKRASWVVRNRLDAIVKSPVDWNAVGV